MTSAGTPTLHEQIAEVEAEIAGLQAKLQHFRRQTESSAPPPTETRPPLDGVRIVDLSWAVFGSLSTPMPWYALWTP